MIPTKTPDTQMARTRNQGGKQWGLQHSGEISMRKNLMAKQNFMTNIGLLASSIGDILEQRTPVAQSAAGY